MILNFALPTTELSPQMSEGLLNSSDTSPTTQTPDPDPSILEITLFSVLGGVVVCAFCVLFMTAICCGVRLKRVARRTGHIQGGGAVSNPLYEGKQIRNLCRWQL